MEIKKVNKKKQKKLIKKEQKKVLKNNKKISKLAKKSTTIGAYQKSKELQKRKVDIDAIKIQVSYEPYRAPKGVIGDTKVVGDSMCNNNSFQPINAEVTEALMEEGIGFPGYQFLSLLMAREEYRKIVETFANEATRNWIKLKSFDKKDKVVDDLEKALSDFNVKNIIRRALIDEGFFGISHVFINSNDGEARLPLNPLENLKKGGLKGFVRVEPVWTTPAKYNTTDFDDPYFYKPEQWWISRQLVHESRLFTFVTKPVGDLLKPSYNFGGQPTAYAARPYVRNWLGTRQSVFDMLKSYSTLCLQTNFDKLLNDDGDKLIARCNRMIDHRDNRSLQLIDETESLFNVAAPISGLSELQEQSLRQLAVVSGIPVVKLLGTTTTGMNNSSDGEIQCFYDNVKAFQESFLQKPIKKILDILQMHLYGKIEDETIGFTFNPLWQLSTKEIAEIEKMQADTVSVLRQSGVINVENAGNALINTESSFFVGANINPKNMQSQSDEERKNFINTDIYPSL